MIKGNTVLAIIPARAGSKGILNKNIKLLDGKPLIGWTIDEALKSNYLDNIMVTTDSNEIVEIANKYGAETPFIRPQEYSDDSATGNDVIIHTLKWFDEYGSKYDFFVYLQPTSPLRKSVHISEVLEMLVNDSLTTSVVSVCESKKHPFWMKKIDNDGYLEDFLKPIELYPNRQDLPKVFSPNGAIYASNWNVYLEDKSFYKKRCLPYVMDEKSSIDLDTINDWEYAEYLLRVDECI